MSSEASSPANPRKEEKLFLIIVFVLATIAGIGSWFAGGSDCHIATGYTAFCRTNRGGWKVFP